MSKKTAVVLSCVIFVLLIVLMICEVVNPAGGPALLRKIF